MTIAVPRTLLMAFDSSTLLDMTRPGRSKGERPWRASAAMSASWNWVHREKTPVTFTAIGLSRNVSTWGMRFPDRSPFR